MEYSKLLDLPGFQGITGWLDKFIGRQNGTYKVVSGESADVNEVHSTVGQNVTLSEL